MSRFLSKAAASIKPYTPGEQPRDMKYIKLNTNENPYPPSPKVLEAIETFNSKDLRLYPDPTALGFREAIASSWGVRSDQVFAGCGSDEVLAFAFMAFLNRGDKVYFPDITYGFYQVYADLFEVKASRIPLLEDYTVGITDYLGLDGCIIIANPNAPTGICLPRGDIERILRENPDRLVLVDEAYIDFAAHESCVGLIDQYDNLLVVTTFSKSRSLAGMRLGAAFGNQELIAALERIKFSFSPYNLDRVAFVAGIAAVNDRDYTQGRVAQIIKTRERTVVELEKIGYSALKSDANFIFAKGRRSGAEIFHWLKKNGVLVRYFDLPRTKDFVRITIGTDGDMDTLIKKLGELN